MLDVRFPIIGTTSRSAMPNRLVPNVADAPAIA
jgi:hypothetical protein